MSETSEPVPEWAMREAETALPCWCDEAWVDRGMHSHECARDCVPDVARALAAAYARGREDATKENVGLLQRVDDLVRRVAAVESYRASSTATAPHNAAKAWLLP